MVQGRRNSTAQSQDTTNAQQGDQPNRPNTNTRPEDTVNPTRQAPPSSIADLMARFSNPLAANSTGEAVGKYMATVRSYLEEKGMIDVIKVTLLDRATTGGPLSYIIVAAGAARDDGTLLVTAHTMIIEASGSKLPNRQLTVYNRPVSIPTVPSDTYNDALWNIIKQSLAVSFGAGAVITDAGSSVIPVEVTPDDKSRMAKLIASAYNAVIGLLGDLTGTTPIFSAGVYGKDSRASVVVDYSPAAQEDIAGLPVRADISLTTGYTLLSERGTTRDDDYIVPTTELVTVDGYTTMQYTPPAQIRRNEYETQCFRPKFVITRVASVLSLTTMETLLMGLFTTTLLASDMGWAAGWAIPKFGDDMHDIGALRVDLPEGHDIETDTKSPSFNLYDYIQAITVNPDELDICMDVPESGADVWLLNDFVLASRNSTDATDRIIAAADRLTDNHFSAIFFANGNTNVTICMDDNVRVANGYWIDGNTHAKRDNREVDYISVAAAMGNIDHDVIVKYDHTYDPTGAREVRFEENVNIMNTLLQNNAKITGASTRITIDGYFLTCIGMALTKAGFPIVAGNAMKVTGGQMRRSYDQGRRGVSSRDVSDLFSTGRTRNDYRSSGGARYGRR